MKEKHANTVGNDKVNDIIDLLKNTDISIRQISTIYDIQVNTVMLINNGTSKKYRRDGVKYPIRSYRHKKPYKS